MTGSARGDRATAGTGISPELKLAIDCCRAMFVRSQARGPVDSGAEVDWQHFVQLARFHRVQGLASTALRDNEDVPDEVIRLLAEDGSQIAADNLQCAAECSRLVAAFERGEVPLLFLKGLAVGALAYSNPLSKMAVDIDILIRPNDLARAAKLLEASGYRLQIPQRGDLRRWHQRRKESVWRKRGGSQLDLHTRLSDNRRLLDGVSADSPTQVVDLLPDISVPTLATDELFAYLCVHGASSAWFRLKWISDFAGPIQGLPASEIERLYRRSQELGAARAAGQALLLADRLFGTLAGTKLRQRLSADRSTRWLAQSAFRQLACGREPTETPFGTWRIHWTQLFLKPGLSFKLSEAARQLRDAIE